MFHFSYVNDTMFIKILNSCEKVEIVLTALYIGWADIHVSNPVKEELSYLCFEKYMLEFPIIANVTF